MSGETSADRQDLSSNARDSRRPRTTAISTEYIYFSDIIPSGGIPYASAYAKENVRRPTMTNKPSEPSRDDHGNPGSAAPPTASPATRLSRRPPSSLNHLSATEIHHPPPAETRSGGNASHSMPALGSTRPLSIPQKSGSPLLVPLDKNKQRKDSLKHTNSNDPRHSKQALSHSPRVAVDKEIAPKWDSNPDKGASDPRPPFTGPIAAASWEHMQREVELLRKSVLDYQKSARKQAKRLEELKTQATAQQKLIEEKDAELSALGQRCSKYSKHMSTVESALQCQICMELPSKPFTLAPCGHVLCLTCLQEWFKTSPGITEDDEDDEDDENQVLYREKTCPCCRTVVKHRPCPAFMVKDIVSTFIQERGGPTQSSVNDASESADDDPWKGIFPNSDDEGRDLDAFSDDDDDDDFGISGFSWMGSAGSPALSRFTGTWNYDTESDDGIFSDDREDDGEVSVSESEHEYHLPVEYVEARWQPPRFTHLDPRDYDLGVSDPAWKLLTRGCSWDMIQNFNMTYNHEEGIIVTLRSIDELYVSDDEDTGSSNDGMAREALHHLYLGWNLDLDPDDEDGETYMHNILDDIKNYPERWRLVPRYDEAGSMDVRRLVATRIGDHPDERYFTSDSEAWQDQDDHDLDID